MQITQNNIIDVMQSCMKKHKDVDYVIKISHDSISVYLYLKYGQAVYSCRVSDHKPNRYKHIRSMILNNKSRPYDIERYVDNTIKLLKQRSFKMALNNINYSGISNDEIAEQFNSIIDDVDID